MQEGTRHVKKMRRHEVTGHSRFLTFSCWERLPLLANPLIRDAFVQSLGAARERYGFELFAYVVMPEHVHLLLRPRLEGAGGAKVASIMRGLKGAFSHHVLKRWKELNAPILSRLADGDGQLRFWQPGGGYDRNVWSDHELLEKIHYIHRNPVERSLCSRATDYVWSSARWYAQQDPWGLRVDPPFVWRGQPPDEAIAEARRLDRRRREPGRRRQADEPPKDAARR